MQFKDLKVGDILTHKEEQQPWEIVAVRSNVVQVKYMGVSHGLITHVNTPVYRWIAAEDLQYYTHEKEKH